MSMTTTKTQANISLRKKKDRKWKERKEKDHLDDFVSRVFHDVCDERKRRTEKTEQF